MKRKMNFTMAAIEALKPPAEDRFYVYDTKLPGLALMVTPYQKRFYVYKRIHGRPTRVPGGTFPATSAEAARAWARVLIGQIEQGENPVEQKRALRHQINFGQAWTAYLEKHLKPHRKPRTLREFERIHEKHLKPWGIRGLATINPGDVAGLHVNIGEKHGHYMANRVLEVVKVVFNYARKQLNWKHANPCEGITKFKEEQRERVLNEDEAQSLRLALDKETDAELVAYVELLFETGQRRGNVDRMQWNQIDLSNGRWLIPGSEFKNGKAQNIALTAHALAILKERTRTESLFVFNGRDFRKGWEGLREAAGLTGVTRHDLRRTVGSRLAEAGASEAVIAKVLGHTTTRSTAVYTRIADKRAKEALEGISGAILGPTNRKKPRVKSKKAS